MSDPKHDLAEIPPLPGDAAAVLRRNWGWFLALGIVWMVCGALAIILPYAAAVAVELVFGGLLAFGGILQVIQSLRCTGWNGKILHAIIGLLSLLAGGILLVFPHHGVLTLTIVLGAFFIAAGTFRSMIALQHRNFAGWGWMLTSGILALGVGIIIFLAWPGSALWALGLLVGIELIFGGWSLIMVALGARSSA